MPGGFKDLSCSLLRRIDIDYPDLGLFDTVRVYAPGNRTVWEGRMAQFPRSHGDGFSITPGAVGWSAHLTDDPSFTEVYVDRDPARGATPRSTAASDSRAHLDGRLLLVAGRGRAQRLPAQSGARSVHDRGSVGARACRLQGRQGHVPRRDHEPARRVDHRNPRPGHTRLGRRPIQPDVRRHAAYAGAHDRRAPVLGLFLYSNGTAATPAAGALVRATKIAATATTGSRPERTAPSPMGSTPAT
jgi:hypothetical protein